MIWLPRAINSATIPALKHNCAMSERVHITTAIFYCNGAPHVGSAYEALAADTFSRALRRKLGQDRVTFLSGTDEHGDKIRRAALAQGLTPKTYTDQMSEVFRQAFAGLNVTAAARQDPAIDFWVRTTDPVHEAFVQEMLRRTYQRGDIYFRDYEGLYCVDCERFYTDKELLPGNLCPSHNRPVELISEGNYFLKIEKYREQVLAHLAANPNFIRPERYRNEALNMLAEPLTDLCISRPKARLDWGIELPFDAKYVTYVWYDAFWAYVSEPATRVGLDAFAREIWPHTEHFIGKDILKTHAVYWPPILLAAGLPLFRHLNVHGWLNFGGARMSKSSGNVADPVSYERAFGADVLRYFVMREVVYGLDGDFSEDRLIERYNADLANDLGNLVSRVLSMAARYFNGELRAAPQRVRAGAHDGVNWQNIEQLLSPVLDRVTGELDFKRALDEVWAGLDAANKYIVTTAPFTLARDPTRLDEVAQILANLLEAIRVIADALEPFMPVTSWKIFELLNVHNAAARAPYGAGLKVGHTVRGPVALFPRIEKQEKA
ncbi:MAG: methionine--tRNA ligase [Acetobacteraceae bacterium]|nr:methionine--tRNA ligase [Acetobacteraceae bacterium]